MPSLLPCGPCCIYVEAFLCPGQDDADKAPRVVVHKDGLPQYTTTFRAGKWCYTVDPSGERIKWPKKAIRIYTMGTRFTSCADCLAQPDPPIPPHWWTIRPRRKRRRLVLRDLRGRRRRWHPERNAKRLASDPMPVAKLYGQRSPSVGRQRRQCVRADHLPFRFVVLFREHEHGPSRRSRRCSSCQR